MNDLFSPTNAFLAVQFLITMYVIFKVRGSSIASHVAAALQEPTQKIADKAADLSNSASELSTTVKQLAGALAYTTDANTRLVIRVDVAENRATAAETKTRDLSNRVDAYAQTIDNLLHDQEEKTKATIERDHKIAGLTQKFDVMTEAFNETKQDLEKTKADLDKTRRELEATKRDLVAAQSRISELERQRDDAIKAASTEKLALETQLQEARGKVAILEDQVKLLEGQIKELQTQLDAQKVKPLDTSLLTSPVSTP